LFEKRQLQEGDIELEDKIAAENFQKSSQTIVDTVETAYVPFSGGLDVILDELSDAEVAVFESRLDVAVDETSESGDTVSEKELSTIVSAPLDAVSGLITDFVARWNRSLGYYASGYFGVDDVPPDQNSDMIDVIALRSKYLSIAEAQQNALLRGYDDINAQWHADGDAVVEASERARDGICAKVRVQIKQRAILTREAFEAELQIENGGNVMSEIQVTIKISQKDTGEEATERFSFGEPELVGITGVNGEGTLEPSTSGTATWIFLALGDAAPEEPVAYDVSGSLSYVMDGVLNTETLLPDTIQVSPDPQLELVYFHEYEIFGDDPFTLEVEPSIPYKLAVLVKNVGFGDAISFRIASAQPEIVENDKGLLVDFTIIEAQVAGEPAETNLEVDFGDIPAMSTSVGIWTLTHLCRAPFQTTTLRSHTRVQSTMIGWRLSKVLRFMNLRTVYT